MIEQEKKKKELKTVRSIHKKEPCARDHNQEIIINL